MTKSNGHSVFVTSHPAGCKYNESTQVGFITPSAPTGIFDFPDWHTHYKITVNADYTNEQKVYAKGTCSFDVDVSTGVDKYSAIKVGSIQNSSSMSPVTCNAQVSGQNINVSFNATGR